MRDNPLAVATRDEPETAAPAGETPSEVPAKDATAVEAAELDAGDLDDPAWDPNATDSAEYRAALTKNLSLELAKSHGKRRIRVVTAIAVALFLALMGLLAYRLVTQKMSLQEAEEKAPPPPSGAVYKAPPPSKPKPRQRNDAGP